MTTYILPLPWIQPPITSNQQRRMHYMAEARIKRQIRFTVGLQAKLARLPKGLARVEIVLNWQPAIARARDEDSLAPTLSSCCDALALGHYSRHPGYGLVADDTAGIVTSRTVIHPVAKPAKFWLEIEDLS
jgi:hypothetical protein